MINKTLIKFKSEILERWINRMYATYPSQTENFLKREVDPFANPVGASIKHTFATLLDELYGDMDTEVIDSALDNLIRIRSVQDHSPSDALLFTFLLKQIVREIFTENHDSGLYSKEIFMLMDKIDTISLRSFDIYMNCREKIYSLRAEEIKRTTYRFLEKARSESTDESV